MQVAILIVIQTILLEARKCAQHLAQKSFPIRYQESKLTSHLMMAILSDRQHISKSHAYAWA